MRNTFSHISRSIILLLVVILGFSSSFHYVAASTYSSSTTRYSQRAVTYVKNYIARLERDGYSDEEILNQIINLRNTYIRRQQLSLYSGRSPIETNMIITELESAISWYSSRIEISCSPYYACSNGYQQYRQYYPPTSPYTPYPTYPVYPYYPYNPTPQIQTLRATDVSLSANTSITTETRTSIVRDNSASSYKDYDQYTFVLQGNGYTNNQPNSSRFLSTSLFREVSTQLGRTIRVSFGAEYDLQRVRNIRTAAQGAYRTSQTAVSLSPSFTDTFYSLGSDEFSRQAVISGSNKIYRTYKLYIARDDSQAFIVEYHETGPINTYPAYSQNIGGIHTSSFIDYGSYFAHNYITSGSSKQYKQYIYIPTSNSDIATIYSNLGINTRMNYHIGTSRTLSVNNERTTTYINGYTVNSGYVSTVESTFASYGVPIYITLPTSSSSFSFYPQTSYVFQNIRLGDGTYRMYRLLVATDGSEAYLTEYVENNPYY